MFPTTTTQSPLHSLFIPGGKYWPLGPMQISYDLEGIIGRSLIHPSKHKWSLLPP